MQNIKLELVYDGTSYLGWQNNARGLSIEKSLQDALKTLLNHDVTLQAASRTDAGVHARGQIVNFLTPKKIHLDDLVYKLNCLLNQDISIQNARLMPLKFHPTLDSKGKIYKYRLCNKPFQDPFLRHTSWHYPFQRLDLNLMKKASQKLIGQYDFSGFSNTCKDPKLDTFCHISSLEITSQSSIILFEIQGDRFLYKMVRNIIGTLVDIGANKLPLESLEKILITQDRKQAGVTAPAHGLFLEKVLY